MTYKPSNTQTPFLDESPFLPEDQEELLVKLTESLRDIGSAVNAREIALYDTQERISGATLYNTSTAQRFRPVFRTVVNFGSLPNTTTKSVAHGISWFKTFQVIKLFGVSNDPSATGASPFSIPIPYASTTLINNIELWVTTSSVVIKTAKDYSAFTVCAIVLEYSKT